MKAFFYTCLVLAGWLIGLNAAQAQTIINLNFESWATRNGVESPTNWLNSDDYLHALLVAQQGYNPYYPTGAVIKSTTAHGGSFAANLTTKSILGVAFPGIAIVGTRLTPNYIGGTPYTTRPAQFQFYYQYTGPVADSAGAFVLVTRTTSLSGQPEILGSAFQYIQPTTGSYASASLPITYTSSATPDSIRILFFSGNARNITVGSTLLVDDVALAGTALAVRADAALQEKLTVSPNPSPAGRFQLSSVDAPSLASSPFTVLDMMGRVVAHQPALTVPSPTRELDLSTLATGIYLLRLDTKDGTIVRQLSIK